MGQQLDQLSVIGRCEYSKTCQLLVQLFDTYAREYQEVCSSPSSTVALSTAEGRLTWLVYIIGSAVGGRVSFNSNEVGSRFMEKGELYFCSVGNCISVQIRIILSPRTMTPWTVSWCAGSCS